MKLKILLIISLLFLVFPLYSQEINGDRIVKEVLPKVEQITDCYYTSFSYYDENDIVRLWPLSSDNFKAVYRRFETNKKFIRWEYLLYYDRDVCYHIMFNREQYRDLSRYFRGFARDKVIMWNDFIRKK